MHHTIHTADYVNPSVFLKQCTPEHIYLSNPDDLSSLTHETSDVFQYLKLQAERGDLKSQVGVIYSTNL